MPKCVKCNCIIKKDFSTCNSCNKTYHPGCVCGYLGSKSARGASLSNSCQRSSFSTMTEPVYNAASSLLSDPQTPLFSFSGEMTLPQKHLQAAAASGASISFVPHQHQQAALIPQSMSSVPHSVKKLFFVRKPNISRFRRPILVNFRLNALEVIWNKGKIFVTPKNNF